MHRECEMGIASVFPGVLLPLPLTVYRQAKITRAYGCFEVSFQRRQSPKIKRTPNNQLSPECCEFGSDNFLVLYPIWVVYFTVCIYISQFHVIIMSFLSRDELNVT